VQRFAARHDRCNTGADALELCHTGSGVDEVIAYCRIGERSSHTWFVLKYLLGYDNVKKKFVNTWGDNMGTGLMMAEGDYDPATKALTYVSEMEMIPGMKTKVREVVTITDKDHHIMEWYEDRGGKDVKTLRPGRSGRRLVPVNAGWAR